MFKAGTDIVKRSEPILAKNATKFFVNKGINELNKSFTTKEGSGLRLTNNEIKDIMKIIQGFRK